MTNNEKIDKILEELTCVKKKIAILETRKVPVADIVIGSVGWVRLTVAVVVFTISLCGSYFSLGSKIDGIALKLDNHLAIHANN
jgi:hypothetical protein